MLDKDIYPIGHRFSKVVLTTEPFFPIESALRTLDKAELLWWKGGGVSLVSWISPTPPHRQARGTVPQAARLKASAPGGLKALQPEPEETGGEECESWCLAPTPLSSFRMTFISTAQSRPPEISRLQGSCPPTKVIKLDTSSFINKKVVG